MLLAAMAVLVACFGGSASAKPYAVGERSYTFVDSSRSTPPSGSDAGASTRTLRTLVLYPARKGKPIRSRHGFPLIAFSHGMGATVPPYRSALDPWVRRGYVVVAPTFPLSSGTAPGGPSLADYREQPADVSFVISRVLRLALGEEDDRPAQHRRGRALARRRHQPRARGQRLLPGPARRRGSRLGAGPARLRGRVVRCADASADGRPRHGGPDLLGRRGALPGRLPTQGAGDPGERPPYPEHRTVGRPARESRRPTGSTATSSTTGGRSGACPGTRTCQAPPSCGRPG